MENGKNNENGKLSKGLGIHARRILAYVVLAIFTFLCLVWFVVLFINSTRSNGQLTAGFTLVPGGHFLDNLKNTVLGDDRRDFFVALWNSKIFTCLRNSFIISICCVVLSIYFSAMTAYAIHAYQFKLRKAAFTFILAIMTIPTQVSVLGFIKLITNMGMDDTFWPLIIPSICSPVTFFYIKQYMDSTLPLSLVEAARLDGAGEFKIFNTIVLPLMKPAMAVQAIFCFVGCWNNYFTPALVISSSSKKTLPIFIAEMRNADYQHFDMGKVYMSITFSILPIIIIYIILSKHIIGDMTTGGVKE